MIKRILFATRKHDLTAPAFPAAWRDGFSLSVDAPADTRPLRAAMSTVMADVTPVPKHDGIGLLWFADGDHQARYESWLSTSGAAQRLHRAIEADQSPVVVADEHVMRGAEWLDQRWRDGGSKLKHMAIARRAKDLTLREFFELWQSRAGKIGTVVIPDEARGLAYVQNRPQLGEIDWAYDALNEVYFDDLDGLQARITYFQETMRDESEADLVSEGWFVAAQEEMLFNQV
jgi:hypothetical protein